MSGPDGGDDVDGGWEDGGGDEGGSEAAVDTASTTDGTGAPGDPNAPRKKRRRRRRGRGGDREAGAPGAPVATAPVTPTERLEGDPYAGGAAPAAAPAGEPRRERQGERPQARVHQQPPPQGQREPRRGRDQRDNRRGGDGGQQPRRDGAQAQDRGGNRGRNRGEGRPRRDDAPPVELADDDVQAQNDLRTRADAATASANAQTPSVGGALRTMRHRADERDDDEAEAAPATTEAWGTDDGSPAPAITLPSDLPPNPPGDDPDPSTYLLVDEPGARLGDDVASVVGVRFVPAGRVSWFDAGDGDFTPGERVLVDADRGSRLGWIATVPLRRAIRERGLRRVIRRANEQDLRGETDRDENRVRALRTAKDKAAALRLPLKVFRIEIGGGKLLVYYTSDDRLDLRDFVRDLAQATGLRPELRQLGVRDEAKAVGGIGSCGLTLCCTTWLPDFVPVSIKMAKDQGLVLSPTKVSGQCGRLKCCLVYEQAAYAELRKGLPKLGKRVVGARGEGRVVEVDVLRQRVRVSYGPGDTEVVLATEVQPLFPSGNQPSRGGGPGRPEPEPDDDDDPDPSALPDDDPSAA